MGWEQALLALAVRAIPHGFSMARMNELFVESDDVPEEEKAKLRAGLRRVDKLFDLETPPRAT